MSIFFISLPVRLRSLAPTMILIFGISNAAGAEDTKHDFSLSGFAGVEYDSTVNVAAIDEATDIGDFAGVFGANLKYEGRFDQKNKVSASYIFRQSTLFELTEFNLQLHGTDVTYTRKAGKLSFGATHQFFLSRLGGDDLLNINRISPFLTFVPTKKLFLRGAYIYKDKNLIELNDRDAQTHAAELLSFFFLDGTHTYLTGAYRYENEDARADEFDFEAHIARVELDTRLPFGGDKNRLEIDLEYEDRDYAAFSPTIEEVRDDERLSLDVSWEVPLTKYFNVTGTYTFRDFSSNFPGADFTENVFRLTLGFEF